MIENIFLIWLFFVCLVFLFLIAGIIIWIGGEINSKCQKEFKK